jgi:CAAX protease family protein
MRHALISVRKHPLFWFFVLAYALSWWAWIPYQLGVFPNPVASFGPFLAALIMLGLTRGKSGVLELLRRMVRWRVAPGWYAVALLLPVVLSAAATYCNVLLGAEAPSSAELNGWPALFSTFAFVLLVPGVGGAWEEPGWRGYALPRLQTGRTALVASLILAVAIACWHLPLMIEGQVAYSDLVLILAAVVVFNWVFNNTNGSVLLIMIMHAANNSASGSFFSPMFTGADSVRQSWLLAAIWTVVAMLVIAIAGPTDLSRKYAKQEDVTRADSPDVSKSAPVAHPS